MVPEVANLVPFFMGAIARSCAPGKLERQKNYEKDENVSAHGGECISGSRMKMVAATDQVLYTRPFISGRSFAG